MYVNLRAFFSPTLCKGSSCMTTYFAYEFPRPDGTLIHGVYDEEDVCRTHAERHVAVYYLDADLTSITIRSVDAASKAIAAAEVLGSNTSDISARGGIKPAAEGEKPDAGSVKA